MNGMDNSRNWARSKYSSIERTFKHPKTLLSEVEDYDIVELGDCKKRLTISCIQKPFSESAPFLLSSIEQGRIKVGFSHPNLQEIVDIDLENRVCYFEISNVNLRTLIDHCQSNRIPGVPEDQLWILIGDMAFMGSFLEDQLDHHPQISIENIFLKDGAFKVMHPYLFDSYALDAKAVINPLILAL